MLRIPRPSLLLLACTPRVTPSRGRKSRHDPTAKSKASRIKYPPVVCVEELLNTRRRYRDYTAVITALRSECKREQYEWRREQREGTMAEQRQHQEKDEHDALMAWNQEENRRALLCRLERVKQEERAFSLQRAAANQLHEETRLQELQERQQEVEHLQELSKTFITPENLVQRIEAALDSPKCYNFCLDREGRILQHTAAGQSAP